MNRFAIAFGLSALLATQSLIAQSSTPTTAPADEETPVVIDPVAADLLKRMSDYLASATAFSFESESNYDVIEADESRVQLSRKAKIKVRRPAGLHVRSKGDDGDREYWYDGKTVTILDRRMKVYSQTEAPDTNDAMFDHMAERYGLSVPVSDLLYHDAYGTLMEGVLAGRLVGVHRVGGRACHHLAFVQEDLAWQIWIEVGDRPLPRKLVVTHTAIPGQPQYMALLNDWDLDEDFDRDEFSFRPSSGMEKIELRPGHDEVQEPETGTAGSAPARPDGAPPEQP